MELCRRASPTGGRLAAPFHRASKRSSSVRHDFDRLGEVELLRREAGAARRRRRPFTSMLFPCSTSSTRPPAAPPKALRSVSRDSLLEIAYSHRVGRYEGAHEFLGRRALQALRRGLRQLLRFSYSLSKRSQINFQRAFGRRLESAPALPGEIWLLTREGLLLERRFLELTYGGNIDVGVTGEWPVKSVTVSTSDSRGPDPS
jgi:hypothetical protein